MLNDATKGKTVIFVVVSGYLLGSLTLWSNSWAGEFMFPVQATLDIR